LLPLKSWVAFLYKKVVSFLLSFAKPQVDALLRERLLKSSAGFESESYPAFELSLGDANGRDEVDGRNTLV
jgi:hypothetical protein